MNTLTIIKKQINKAAALHDAQITLTKYRGVDYEVRKAVQESHGTFCYRGRTYTK
jgi:hypothetical protein